MESPETDQNILENLKKSGQSGLYDKWYWLTNPLIYRLDYRLYKLYPHLSHTQIYFTWVEDLKYSKQNMNNKHIRWNFKKMFLLFGIKREFLYKV